MGTSASALATTLSPLAAKVKAQLEEAAKQTGLAKRVACTVDNHDGMCRLEFNLLDMVQAAGKSATGNTEGIKLDINGPVTVNIPGVGDTDFMLEGNGLWLKVRVLLPQDTLPGV